MKPGDSAEITRLLRAWASGDRVAFDRLVPMVYKELHRIARRHMRREHAGNTLQTTALVNEAVVRLMGGVDVDWRDRVHFFAVSAHLMRRILVDAARARLREKRGGGQPHVDLDEAIDVAPGNNASIVALDEALSELARFDSRKARVVELRHYGGLSVEETADVLQVSPQTVLRDWKLAKAWLAKVLNRS